MLKPEQIKNPSTNQSPHEVAMLVWDIGIIVLVAVNLLLLLADSTFAIGPINELLAAQWPAGHQAFDRNIHQHFQSIDLVFIAIFVTDVLLGWSLAIIQKRHERWWFYPFVHWYDVLGCIPVAGFRILRVLRIVAMTLRLQRLGIIDIRNWAIYRFAQRYYDIVIEELSDRIVENVLSGIQEEVRHGGSELPVRVINEVIKPRQAALVDSIASQIEKITDGMYEDNRTEIHAYIDAIVSKAVHNNGTARRIDKIPGLGDAVIHGLENAISNTARDSLDGIAGTLSSDDFGKLLHQILENILSELLNADHPGDDVSASGHEVVVEVLELVKEQVRKQRWKTQFSAGELTPAKTG